MYGGYGGNSKDSPSEKGGRFGGGGLGSPSKSASKSSSSASKAGSTGSARSDTPSSNRSKGGLGTASKASKDTASKAAVGSSGRSIAEARAANRPTDRTPATGFNLADRTRMGSVTYSGSRSPGFENKSSVPARSVPTQSFTPSSPASTVPQSVMDRTGYATSYPTGFSLKGRTRMSSMGDMATARAADRRSVADYSGVSGTTPATKGFGASVGDMDLAQQRRATENQVMDQLNAINGILGAAGKVESRKTDPYNSLVYGGPTTHAPLTDMTITEVADFQKTMRQKGHPTTAVGAYQTIASTLMAATKRLGFNPDTTKLSPAVQDIIGMDLTYNRLAKATKNGVVNVKDFVSQLRSEWDGFKNVSDKELTSLAQSVIDSGLVGNDYTPAVAGTPGDDFETRAPEMAGDTVPEAPAGQTFPDAPAPPRNVLNLPNRAPKPTPRNAPAYKRSGLGTVIAGGLDLLSSVGGIPALVGQGLSYLATGKSLGENAVDYVSQNENYFQPGEGTDRPGYGDPEQSTADFLAKRKKAAEKKAKAEEPTYDFVEKYIEFNDPTVRPTPEQKWDWRSSKYIGVT